MRYEVRKIAEIGQQQLEQWVLENNGYYIKILNYGATWQDWICEDESLLYQLPNECDYLINPYHVGHTIGRVAGRIKNGKFKLKDKIYQLPTDGSGHVVHSTTVRGFDSYFWDGQVKVQDKQISLLLTINTVEDGFPGNMQVTVEYILAADGSVAVEYTGISDELTLFNPTTHVYFNLNHQKTIETMYLQINSKEHLEVDDNKIPTGEKVPNKGGYYFNSPTKLAKNLKLLTSGELDTAFVVPNDQESVVINGEVGKVTVETDRNAAIIFTANPLENSLKYTALAVEMQMLPDAINNQGFGNIILPAKTKIKYRTKFKYQK